jgi:hypothetical protein
MQKFWIVGLLGASLAGCASNVDRLQLATCTTVSCAPAEVQVQQVQRGMTTVNWVAHTPQGTYMCRADDMVRQTVCQASR